MKKKIVLFTYVYICVALLVAFGIHINKSYNQASDINNQLLYEVCENKLQMLSSENADYQMDLLDSLEATDKTSTDELLKAFFTIEYYLISQEISILEDKDGYISTDIESDISEYLSKIEADGNFTTDDIVSGVEDIIQGSHEHDEHSHDTVDTDTYSLWFTSAVDRINVSLKDINIPALKRYFDKTIDADKTIVNKAWNENVVSSIINSEYYWIQSVIYDEIDILFNRSKVYRYLTIGTAVIGGCTALLWLLCYLAVVYAKEVVVVNEPKRRK